MTLKDEVMQHDKIYSFLYGRYMEGTSNTIIEIVTSDLTWSLDNQEFFYIWGWPGPDANLYSRSSFGSGWAFNRATLEEYAKNVEATNSCRR